jgi:MFS family permease
MAWRSSLSYIFRIILLALIFMFIMSASSLVLGLADTGQSADTVAAGQLLLGVSFLYSIVLSYPIIRSSWFGWPLVLTIAVVLFGIMTFLSQIETVVFLKYLVDIVPAEVIPKLFLQGAIVAIIFAPLAVLVLGKIKRRDYFLPERNNRLVMPIGQWIWKLALLAVIYVLIYIGFGMFVFLPLAGDAFQQFYTGLEMPSWILPFQALRALIWVVLALPVIRMMKGSWWEAGLAVSLLYSVLMGGLLLMPDPFMPETISKAHCVEVLTSNFLFGWIVVWVLNLGAKTQKTLRHHNNWNRL